MAGKKGERQFQIEVSNQDQWNDMLASNKGLTVVDVYPAWSGPCAAIVSTFRRLMIDYGADVLHFAKAVSDKIPSLEKYSGKSEPTFLFYAGGVLVSSVRGCNSPVLQKTIAQLIEIEKKIADGSAERVPYVDNEVDAANAAALKEEEAISRANAIAVSQTESEVQYTLAIVKPDASDKVDDIIAMIEESGLQVVQRADHIELSKDRALEFYKEHEGKDFYTGLTDFMSSGPITAIIISGDHAIFKFRKIIGPTNSQAAKESAPDSIRAKFGTDGRRNAVHGSDSPDSARREIHFFFPEFDPTASSEKHDAGEGAHHEDPHATHEAAPPTHTDGHAPAAHGTPAAPHADAAAPKASSSRPPSRPASVPASVQYTFAMIKPDAAEAGKAEDIIERINAGGFTILEKADLHITKERAHEFYKEHEGKEFYEPLTDFMSSGPIVALVLRRINAITSWRALCGPTNSENARKTHPDSLRALYGTDGRRNAVHGSDSVESAKREIAFFFPEFAPEEEDGVSVARKGSVGSVLVSESHGEKIAPSADEPREGSDAPQQHPQEDQPEEHEEAVHEPQEHEEPAHEEPTAPAAHEEPAHEEPVAHEEPAHEEPAHEEPAHEEPAHEEPAHEEP
eukprot:Opistho-2@20677